MGLPSCVASLPVVLALVQSPLIRLDQSYLSDAAASEFAPFYLLCRLASLFNKSIRPGFGKTARDATRRNCSQDYIADGYRGKRILT